MEKKKIVFMMPSLEFGGVEKALTALLAYMDYDRYEVELALEKDDMNVFLPEVDPRVKINFFARYRFWPLREIYHLIHRSYQKYSVLPLPLQAIRSIFGKLNHVHTSRCARRNIQNCDLIIAYHHMFSIPRYVIDDVRAEKKLLWYHGNAVDQTMRAYMERADYVVAASEGIRQTIIETAASLANKVGVVRNFINIPQIRALSLEPSPLPEDERFQICSCARFSREKGFDLAIQAAKQLKEEGLAFRWFIVGDGPEKGALDDLVRELGLENEVVLPGAAANPYPYMAACDLFVQPSREEPYGLTMVEAHILGKPVVSTDTVGGRTLVEDGVTGVLCRAEPEQIAAAVRSLISAPLRLADIKAHVAELDYDRLNQESARALNETLERILSEDEGEDKTGSGTAGHCHRTGL